MESDNDKEVRLVLGIQRKERNASYELFEYCRKYFRDSNRRQLLGDMPGARTYDDIFTDSMSVLWMEIETQNIYVRDNHLWRKNQDGEGHPMTAALTTFMITIAKNKYREEHKQVSKFVSELDFPTDNFAGDDPHQSDDDERLNIAKACLGAMASNCRELLNAYYINELDYDDIISLLRPNQTYNGLKNSKARCLKELRMRVIEVCKRRKLIS